MRTAVLLCTLLLAACATPAAPRYYALTARATGTPVADGPVLVVERVGVPAEFDRSPLVRRLNRDSGAVQLEDMHLWSEALADALKRVLALNLSRTLASARVYQDIRHAPEPNAARLWVDIQHLSFTGWDSVEIEAVWTLRDRDGLQRSGRFTAAQPSGHPTPAASVAALDALLVRLAHAISEKP